MTGKGPRQERETTITFSEDRDTASIWTSSEPMYRKLKKLGFYPVEDRDRSATFKVPRKCISVKKPKILSEKQRAASLRSLQAARIARFSSGAPVERGVQPPNSSEIGKGRG